MKEADVVISLETRLSGVDAYADVVFPVAVDTERAGSYVNWEGRVRPFGKILKDANSLTDGRVLAMIADAMDRPIGSGEPGELRRELEGLGSFSGTRAPAPAVSSPAAPSVGAGQAVLASWRHLLDLGVLQAGESTSPRRSVHRLPVSRRRLQPQLVQVRQMTSPLVRATGQSRCRSSSRICPTVWCGCQVTRRIRPSTRRSVCSRVPLFRLPVGSSMNDQAPGATGSPISGTEQTLLWFGHDPVWMVIPQGPQHLRHPSFSLCCSRSGSSVAWLLGCSSASAPTGPDHLACCSR